MLFCSQCLFVVPVLWGGSALGFFWLGVGLFWGLGFFEASAWPPCVCCGGLCFCWGFVFCLGLGGLSAFFAVLFLVGRGGWVVCLVWP